MRFFTFSLFAAAILLACAADDRIKYSGIRLDLSALALNRDIVRVLGLNIVRTSQSKYSDCTDSHGSTTLTLSSVKVDKCTAAETRFVIGSFKYTKPSYILNSADEAMHCAVSFTYQVTTGGRRVEGTGTAVVFSRSADIVVIWAKPYPEIRIPEIWNVNRVTMSPVSAHNEWVRELLEDSFSPEFRVAALNSMKDFGTVLLGKYLKIASQLPHNKLDLTFENTLVEFKPTIGDTVFSLAFHTSMIVNNRIKVEVVKTIEVPLTKRKYGMRICRQDELVATSLDAVTKGGYFDNLNVVASDWGFATDKVSEFFEILPDLRRRYRGTENFLIACKAYKFETTKGTYGFDAFGMPLICSMRVGAYAGPFLTANVYVKGVYHVLANNLVVFTRADSSSLQSLTTNPPLSADSMEAFQKHADKYAESFAPKDIAAPALRMAPLREDEMSWNTHYVTDANETCFDWNEKRHAFEDS